MSWEVEHNYDSERTPILEEKTFMHKIKLIFYLSEFSE